MKNALQLLKLDLQRIGIELGDDEYLNTLLLAAKQHLSRQGIETVPDYDYTMTAAWMYRKRITGETEPAYLRQLRHDILASQKMKGEEDA